MKKLIVLSLCGVLIGGCSLETVEPEVKEEVEPEVVEKIIEFTPRNVEASYIIIDSDRLNVRTDADVDSDRVGEVKDNETYQVLEEKLDSQKRIWYKINTSEGITGYVAGWFCAKTNITIRVEADNASILDIESQPIPRYVDNPFETKNARVGDQIVGLVIKEISQVAELNKVVFDGEVELTGKFFHENLSSGKVVRFVPDEASSVLLPRVNQDVSSVVFILEDYDKVSGDFGDIGTVGFATMTIKDYKIGYGASNAYNQAVMVDVEIE